MQRSEVQVGGVYATTVNKSLVQVRIDEQNRYGGWEAVNLSTGKKIRIKSPDKLRAASDADDTASVAEMETSPTKHDDAVVSETTTADTQTDEINKTRTKRAKAEKPKRPGALDAAARVLEESGQPMTVKEIVEAAEAKGYWKSPGGKTPWATVYSAILREIQKRGQDSRFRKAERGKFIHA